MRVGHDILTWASALDEAYVAADCRDDVTALEKGERTDLELVNACRRGSSGGVGGGIEGGSRGGMAVVMSSRVDVSV